MGLGQVGAMLAERGLLMRQGTIVDATIIAAPPSTKNKEKSRHRKLRYRGLAKNTAQLLTLFALANLVIVKKTLLAKSPA